MTRNYRKFYALLKQLPSAEKGALVLQFTNGRTDSLQAMYGHEYQLMLAAMEGKAITQHLDGDKYDTWRKRVMASIGGWLSLMENEKWKVENDDKRTDDSVKIKAIACRAAGRERFNDITLSELRAIYAEFNNKQKAARNTKNLQLNNN